MRSGHRLLSRSTYCDVRKQKLLLIAPSMINRPVVVPLFILTLAFAAGPNACAQNLELSAKNEKLFHQTPDTPARLLRSASAAARLNHTLLARGYLESVLDGGLSDEAWLKLHGEVGIELFLRLNSNADLQPMAGDLLKQANATTSSATVFPKQAASLVAQLGLSRQETIAAGSALSTIGNPAAGALLAADIQTQTGSMAFDLLRKHPRRFRYGIMNVLSDLTPEQAVRGIQVLATTADPDLAPLLLKYEFSSTEESIRLAATSAVNRLWSGSHRPRTADGAIDWLTQKAVTLLSVSADRFSTRSGTALKQAVQFAEVADTIDSDNRATVAATLLACRAAGSATDDATNDPDVRQAAIDIAIKANHGKAVAALLNSDSKSLHLAINISGAEVRVKAAVELLKQNRNVRGLAYAKRVIRNATNGSLTPEAVVIDPRQDAANQAKWLLEDQGYVTTPCATGQGGFDNAVRQLNCELILIHSNCLRWPLSQTIANLRADSRTSQTPIAIYGPERDNAAIRRMQSLYPGISHVPGPLSEINFADELRRSHVPGPLLTEEGRSHLVEQARAAAAL
jgi:hypothetical protein